MIVKKFLGEVEGQEVKVYDEGAYLSYLKKFGDGNQVYLIIKPVEYTRSEEANKYYWGVVLTIIGKETGHTTEELHEFFKTMFLRGQIKIGEVEGETTLSTADLEKAAFNEYIETIKLWAHTNLNILIPNNLE